MGDSPYGHRAKIMRNKRRLGLMEVLEVTGDKLLVYNRNGCLFRPSIPPIVKRSLPALQISFFLWAPQSINMEMSHM